MWKETGYVHGIGTPLDGSMRLLKPLFMAPAPR